MSCHDLPYRYWYHILLGRTMACACCVYGWAGLGWAGIEWGWIGLGLVKGGREEGRKGGGKVGRLEYPRDRGTVSYIGPLDKFLGLVLGELVGRVEVLFVMILRDLKMDVGSEDGGDDGAELVVGSWR